MVSSSVKRQRKRKRVDQDGDPEFQVAPMVDVLLVLMLFFMAITSTEVLKKDPKLELADAKNAKPADQDHNKKHEIIVNVKWDSIDNVAQFSLDGVNYPTADSMQDALTSQHQRDPIAYVVIRADKNVEYSNEADLMNTCANAGIATVSFAVMKGGNDKPTSGPGGSASN